MTTHNQDWKDIANAQFSKALALSLTLLIFGIMVTPKVEVRKQVFKPNKWNWSIFRWKNENG